MTGKALAAEEFAGIQQDGEYLGNPKAPYALVEYSDMQCPACKMWSDSVIPWVVSDLVRTGKLRFALRPVGILGQDSTMAANFAWAAARQNKLHEFAKIWYLNQGRENSGYVSDEFARIVASAVPGLDPVQLIADSRIPHVVAGERGAHAAFVSSGSDSVPTFMFGRSAGTLRQLRLGDGDGPSAVAALRSRMGR